MGPSIEYSRRNTILKTVISFALFLIIWTAYVIIKRHVELPTIIPGYLSIGDLFWLGSGAVLIYINRRRLYISPGEMFSTLPKPGVLLPLLAIVAAYYTASMFLTYGGFHLNPDDNIPGLILMFLIVGLQEELLFRGYFLNHLAAAMTERKANLWSALFFLFIHFPGWILRGYSAMAILSTGAGIFLLGLLFGWSFRKSRSIWTSVILHTVWDVLSTVVF